MELSLYPLRNPSSHIPRALYGWHVLHELRKYQQRTRLNHVFIPSLKYYSIFRRLSNPIIATVQAGLPQRRGLYLDKLKKLDYIIVGNERDGARLADWGFQHFKVIRTGVDTGKILPSEKPLDQDLTLLMASAPWEKSQFVTKGVDMLLDLARKDKNLRLIFLWRGLMCEDLMIRIRKRGVGDRVEVINERVDINRYLQRAHGTVLLSKFPELVKDYPHSLVESLAAAKPVIISSSIAMSDYVSQQTLGEVVHSFDLNTLSVAIDAFRSNYNALCTNVAKVGAADFSPGKMLDEISEVYRLFGVLPGKK